MELLGLDKTPIPVVALETGQTVPEGTCYLVTRDGIFLHKRTGLVESTVKVDGICFLAGMAERATLHIPKIPVEVMAQALLFFRKIHETLNSEVCLLLHYRADGPDYRFTCPSQEVGAASVDYHDSGERLEGYQLVGTIHSHNTMTAFHSGVDRDDEATFDGLHITVGSLQDFPRFSACASVVVNAKRFKVEPDEFLAGLKHAVLPKVKPPRREFLSETAEALRETVDAAAEAVNQFVLGPRLSAYYGYYEGQYSGGESWRDYYRPTLYELDFDWNQPLGGIISPQEWFARVRKRRYFSYQVADTDSSHNAKGGVQT